MALNAADIMVPVYNVRHLLCDPSPDEVSAEAVQEALAAIPVVIIGKPTPIEWLQARERISRVVQRWLNLCADGCATDERAQEFGQQFKANVEAANIAAMDWSMGRVGRKHLRAVPGYIGARLTVIHGALRAVEGGQ